jgi:hypothetical protein
MQNLDVDIARSKGAATNVVTWKRQPVGHVSACTDMTYTASRVSGGRLGRYGSEHDARTALILDHQRRRDEYAADPALSRAPCASFRSCTFVSSSGGPNCR